MEEAGVMKAVFGAVITSLTLIGVTIWNRSNSLRDRTEDAANTKKEQWESHKKFLISSEEELVVGLFVPKFLESSSPQDSLNELVRKLREGVGELKVTCEGLEEGENTLKDDLKTVKKAIDGILHYGSLAVAHRQAGDSKYASGELSRAINSAGEAMRRMRVDVSRRDL